MMAIMFFAYKELSEEEEEQAGKEWDELLEKLPEGIEITTVDHAFGTEYNGFLIIEADDFQTYLRFWKSLKDDIRWYVSRTRTIIGIER